MAEHTPPPWHFERLSETGGALHGWILPEGVTADDEEPCVAYVEGVGAVDLVLILAGPSMLAVLESVYVDLVDYSKRLSGSYDTGAIALGSCADQVHAVIRKARGEG